MLSGLWAMRGPWALCAQARLVRRGASRRGHRGRGNPGSQGGVWAVSGEAIRRKSWRGARMDVFTREMGVFAFGPFRLDPVRRALLRDGERVRLGARLFDTLLYLVENHDRLVERDELQLAVWPGRIVEEGNLGQAISALRKALQADASTESFIVTVAGRGYRFGAPVEFQPALGAVSADLLSAPNRPGARFADTAPDEAAKLRPAARWTILALSAAACFALLWHFLPAFAPAGPPPFVPPPRSIAVLAFTNLSGDPSQEYFSDGLSEELIDSLSRIRQLQVAARTSSFLFKAQPATIGDIARKLNVGAVLEGSVRRQGTQLRITAQLIDATTGYQEWSHTYDRALGDLLKAQEDIAAAVAESLRVTLLGGDVAKLTLGGTANPKALDAYLRGMALMRRGEEPDCRAAVPFFDAALSQDSSYATAQVGRAAALECIAATGGAFDDHKAYAEAKEAADRALVLAPDLGVAHAVRAKVHMGMLEFRAAEAQAARALALAPGDALVEAVYAWIEVLCGHATQGVQAARVAASLDPLTGAKWQDLALDLYYARLYEPALEALRHEAALTPLHTPSDADLLGSIEFFKGDAEASRQACAGGTNWNQNECLAIAYHALGKPGEALAQFAKLRAILKDDGAFNYAEVYAQWGQTAEALAWLARAYALHDSGLVELKATPTLDPIRDTPEFKDIERRLYSPS